MPRALRFGLTLALASLVVALVGFGRLARQFPGASATPGLLAPFLPPVLALSLEAGSLVALSMSQLSSLSHLATLPIASRARSTLLLVALLIVVISGAQLIPRGTEHPGAFANQLVQTARDSCRPGAAVAVPLLGLNATCERASGFEGPMPGARGVHVAMRDLAFSDDLRRMTVNDLELTASKRPRLHLLVGSARIAGLAPWSRSPRLTPLERCLTLTLLGVALWLGGTVWWRPRPRPGDAAPPRATGVERGLAVLLLGAPSASVAATFIALDQQRAAPAAYAAVAVQAALSVWLLGLLGRRLPRIFRSFGAF